MPTKQYNIIVKGIVVFRKYTQIEFERVCSDMDKLGVTYTTEIIKL